MIMLHSWSNFKDKLKTWCQNETNQVGQTFSFKYIPEKEVIIIEFSMYDKYKEKRTINKDSYYRISNKNMNDTDICSTIIQSFKRKFKDRDHIGYKIN